MGWLEYVIGGAAVLISAISLQVAVNANRTQERQRPRRAPKKATARASSIACLGVS